MLKTKLGKRKKTTNKDNDVIICNPGAYKVIVVVA